MNITDFRIGIDLGGTKTEIVILDQFGKEYFRKRQKTPRISGAEEYECILKSLRDLVACSVKKLPLKSTYTIGIGTPGSLDPITQLLRNSNTTCLNGKPLKRDIEKILKKTVTIENDANCFTLAESLKGAGKNYSMVFGIIMGTGCGGGICIDGRLHTGRNSISGEWGHCSIDPNGPSCYCGKRGCIETKISGAGVENNYFTRFGKHLCMTEIFKRYRRHDPCCTEFFLQFIDDFGRAVGGLISLLDPDVVVIGGGLSNIDELYDLGVERIKYYAFHPQITTPIFKNVLGDSAGVYGAAWIGE